MMGLMRGAKWTLSAGCGSNMYRGEEVVGHMMPGQIDTGTAREGGAPITLAPAHFTH